MTPTETSATKPAKYSIIEPQWRYIDVTTPCGCIANYRVPYGRQMWADHGACREGCAQRCEVGVTHDGGCRYVD